MKGNSSKETTRSPSWNERKKERLNEKYSKINDNYTSLEQVTKALMDAGLESSNLIVGIDFTSSNTWKGTKSFNGKSLHHLGNVCNPYEQAISIIGKTLPSFDEDNMIPCFGFGDATTRGSAVFSFYPNEEACNGFQAVLSRPTSFAPVIKMAMKIVEDSGGQYHVLLIIADGQVGDTDRSVDSSQAKETIQAIVEASKYPLSIVLVGVGDGPWDKMKEFDDSIPARDFDNFQFVNFTEIMAKNTSQTRKETEFALAALMEIPSQYKATNEFGLLDRRRGTAPPIIARPPPGPSQMFESNLAPYYSTRSHVGTAPPEPGLFYDNQSHDASSTYDDELCPICVTNRKDMAFGCNHRTCHECGQNLQNCPICRSYIQTKIITRYS